MRKAPKHSKVLKERVGTDLMLRHFAILAVSLLLIAPLRALAGSGEENHVIQVAVGYAHTCALLRSGQVYCWGVAHVNGRSEDSQVAVPVEGLPKIKSISAGQVNSCAIDVEDQVWCWGVDLQASIKTRKEVITTPKQVAQLPAVSQVASGYLHNCAIAKSDGSVFCWGENAAGELGIGTTDEGKLEASAIPLKAEGLKGATWVATGVNNTCAVVAGGQIYCWGTDDQRGNGVVVKSNVPRHHNESRNVSKVVNGRNFFCALTVDGKVICFGSNLMGQLGSKEAGSIYTQAQPKGIDKALDIGAGGFSACAVTPSRNVLCWGQLPGQDAFEFEGSEPVVIPGLSGAESLSLGIGTACAVIRGGRVKCWGSNEGGQVGNGITSTEEVTTPTDVIGLPGEERSERGYQVAAAALMSGEYEEALRLANDALTDTPEHTGLHLVRGQALVALGKPNSAIADLNVVVAAEPENADALLSRGIAYGDTGDHESALADLSKAIAIKPREAAAYGERSWIYHLKAQKYFAKKDLDKALSLDPNFVDSLSDRAFTLYLSGAYKKSADVYTRVLELEPDNTSARSWRAANYKELKQYLKGIADLDLILSEEPDSSNLLKRAELYLLSGDSEKALTDANKAVDLDPSVAFSLQSRGDLLLAMGKKAEALDDYNAAIKLDPKNTMSWMSRVDYYLGEGEYDKALSDIDKAVEIAPRSEIDFEIALSRRSEIHHELGHYDKAIDDLRLLIDSFPGNAALYRYQVATVLATRGDFKVSEAELNKAIAATPNEPRVYFLRGVVRDVGGDLEGALKDFSEFSKLSTPDVYSALWLDIVRRKSHLPSTLKADAEKFDLSEWPGPIVAMLLGDISKETLIRNALNVESRYVKGRVCEALFFSAQDTVVAGNKSEALELFGRASQECPHNYIQRTAAARQLDILRTDP